MKIKIPATSANLGPGFDVLGLALDLYNIVEILPFKDTKITIDGYGKDNKAFLTNNMFVRIFYEIYCFKFTIT